MVAFDIVLWINKGSCTRFSMNWRRDEAAFNQSSHLGDCRLVLFLTSHYGNFEFIPKQNCIMNPCAQHLALTINNSCPCHFTLTPSLHCMEASPQQNIIVSTPICTFKNFFKKITSMFHLKKNLSSLILWNTKLSHRYIRAFAACCPNSLKSGSSEVHAWLIHILFNCFLPSSLSSLQFVFGKPYFKILSPLTWN